MRTERPAGLNQSKTFLPGSDVSGIGSLFGACFLFFQKKQDSHFLKYFPRTFGMGFPMRKTHTSTFKGFDPKKCVCQQGETPSLDYPRRRRNRLTQSCFFVYEWKQKRCVLRTHTSSQSQLPGTCQARLWRKEPARLHHD